MTRKTKEKISKALKLYISKYGHPLEGRHLSIEHKEKVRKALLIRNREKFLRRVNDTPFEKLRVKDKIKVVFEEVGNKCEACNYEYTDPETGKGPFEIHHIDGDHKNWTRNNLKVLCLNCHWKTPNWRFKGKTHSKHTRVLLSELAKKQHRGVG